MFKCQKCLAQESEIQYLRERCQRLEDRLVAIADARAFGLVTAEPSDGDYYGDGDDYLLSYDADGREVMVKK